MYHFDSPIKKFNIVLLMAILFRVVSMVYDTLLGPFDQHSLYPSLVASNFSLFIDIVLIGPIYEEFIYRFSIFRSDFRKWAYSFSCFISYVCVLVWWEQMYLDNLLVRNLVKVLGSILIFAVLKPVFSNIDIKLFDRVKSYWGSIYISSLIFACFHIRVSLSSFSILMDQVLYILPMFFLGLILCLFRIRFGFIYAIIFHILYNLPSGLAVILL